MNDSLIKKFNEKSVEYEVLNFLKDFSHLDSLYAFTGGVAFGAYLGHLPRRLNDIDMVTNTRSFPEIKAFLEKKGFHEVTQSKVIKEFQNDKIFFEIDIHVEYLYLSLPPKWEILEKFPLIEALRQRIKLPLSSLDRGIKQNIYVISPEYHFLIKLFPPIESSNLHDLLYLTMMWKEPEDLIEKVCFLINKYKFFKDFFIQRLKQYIEIAPRTIWFTEMDRIVQKKVHHLWKKLL